MFRKIFVTLKAGRIGFNPFGHFIQSGKADSRDPFPIHIKLKIDNSILADEEEENLSVFNRAMPVDIAIHHTMKCNLKCYMCIGHQAPSSMSNPEMDVNVFKKISDQCLPYAETVSLAVLGEPFVDIRINDILDELQKCNIGLNIYSNFTAIKDEHIEKLANCKFLTLHISFDAATKHTYEFIRKGAKYDEVLNNIRKFVSYKQKALGSSRSIIRFQYVLMRKNVEELPDFVFLAKGLGIDFIDVSYIVVNRKEMREESLFYYKEIATEYILRAKKNADSVGITITHPIIDGIDTEHKGSQKRNEDSAKTIMRCRFLWKHTWINYNGDILPCSHLERPIMGNINEQPFSEVWNGKLYQEMRRGIREGNLFNCCKRCSHLEQTVTSPQNEDSFVIV